MTRANDTGRQRWRRWELALAAGLLAAVLAAGWADCTGRAVAQKLVRLHVIANSNSAADQLLKLKVRDRILEEAALLLSPGDSRETAARRLTEGAERLAAAGREAVLQAGCTYPVTVSLGESWFPTRRYGGVSLPAGEYQALRVVIGQGAGENWWCVVFPPLCLGAVSDGGDLEALAANLTPEEVQLLTSDSQPYILKFRLLELWGELQHGLAAD